MHTHAMWDGVRGGGVEGRFENCAKHEMSVCGYVWQRGSVSGGLGFSSEVWGLVHSDFFSHYVIICRLLNLLVERSTDT